MSEQLRDLSEYGITPQDQRDWQDVAKGYRDMPPFPEALKDKTKPVLVLNMIEQYTKDHHKNILRLLMGNIDGVFQSGLQTEEIRAERKQFDDSFRQDALFDGTTFRFGRTQVLHLPDEQYELTKQPTEWEWGKSRVQDTPADEVIAMFDVPEIDQDVEFIIAPPPQVDIGQYAIAIEKAFGKTPHVAFWTVTRFADSVSWSVTEYRPGMPNLMGMENGAL